MRVGDRVAAILLFLAVPVAACGASPPAGGEGATRYGYGPSPDAAVTYQPDVVIVAGGPDTIRGVSRDGFTYTIDAGAEGADKVRPGAVMFLTSDAVGRVVKMRREGDALDVTLAPVALTEIVRDGHFTVDQTLDVDEQSFQALPDLLGEIPIPDDEPGAGGGGGDVPRIVGSVHEGGPVVGDAPRPVAPAVAEQGGPPPVVAAVAVPGLGAPRPPEPARSQVGKAKVGGWDVQAFRGAGELGLYAEHSTAASGLRAGLDVRLLVDDLRVRGDITVANGTIVRPWFQVEGIKAIAIAVRAGVAGGLEDNKKVKIELPVELKQPILIGGFPATLRQTFKFLVQTAFSAKNGNLRAGGEWGLDGPIGMRGGTVVTPAFSVRKSVLDSLQGVSVGVEGIVVAAEFRFGLMVGLPVAGAGPAVGVVASLGLTNGSAAGRVGLPLAGPAVKCRGATLVLTGRGSVGVNLSTPLTTAIDKVLGVKIPADVDLVTKDIVSKTVVEPDVPLCRSGG
jgi:hypothetical protein